MLRNGQYAEAGTLRMIAAGGVWTKARLQREFAEDAYDREGRDDIICTRCGQEPDDDLHRFWTCKEIGR
eukprot:12427795-Karenia_brevis.AAC.1